MNNYDRMSKIFVWANSDMDGATSVILLGNIFPKFDYKSCFFGIFEEKFLEWSKTNLDNYDKIFVVGMVLDQKLVNKIDSPNIVFISDRQENLMTIESKIISKDSASCCKIIYDLFKEKVIITDDIKKLVLYTSDYNSYSLKYKESENLNAIYRSYLYNKFGSFVNRFWKGYDKFTDNELNIVDNYFKNILNEVENLELFEGTFKNYKVLSTISKYSPNELTKYLLENYDHDIIIVVNLDTQFVSFRKNTNSDVDLGFVAQYLCDGGGTTKSAGGTITEKFLEFTKTFTEI